MGTRTTTTKPTHSRSCNGAHESPYWSFETTVETFVMKALHRLLLAFALSFLGLVLTTVGWINDDFYKAIIPAHPAHPAPFHHNLAWLQPYLFFICAAIALTSFFCLLWIPYNWREPYLILAGVGLVALTLQPIRGPLTKRIIKHVKAFCG
jgi:hypothetical protein